jgi:hypothetical protein
LLSREEQGMRHENVARSNSFDLVDVAAIWPNGLTPGAPLTELEQGWVQPEAAAPDMPAAAGKAMVAVYAGLMGAFILTMTRGGEATFVVAISCFYVAMFLGVPALFLKVEQREAKRPSIADSLASGMDTATGRISGAGALTQMLIVPALLTVAILAIGTIAGVTL